MPEPRVSIVIPTFNRPANLERCLKSISALDYPRDRFETLIVNDGGTLPSEQVVFRIVSDIAVTVLSQPNRGPAAARNTGIAAARGEFIVFIDDDCVVPPDWLTNVEAAIEKTPDTLIGGRTVNLFPENVFSETSQLIVDYVYRYYDGSAGNSTFFASNNIVVRSDLIRDIGGFDENFRTAEDRELCRRWAASGRPFSYAPDVVVMHGHHLTLASLHAQHFSYGRGALPFWTRGTDSTSGFHVEPPRFYSGMFAFPFVMGKPAAPLLSALIVSTQVANAAGFFFEAVKTLLSDRSAALVDHSILHDKSHVLSGVNVLEGIAGNGNDVRQLAGLD
jgi:GT2 family glycosyltransferase